MSSHRNTASNIKIVKNRKMNFTPDSLSGISGKIFSENDLFKTSDVQPAQIDYDIINSLKAEEQQYFTEHSLLAHANAKLFADMLKHFTNVSDRIKFLRFLNRVSELLHLEPLKDSYPSNKSAFRSGADYIDLLAKFGVINKISKNGKNYVAFEKLYNRQFIKDFKKYGAIPCSKDDLKSLVLSFPSDNYRNISLKPKDKYKDPFYVTTDSGTYVYLSGNHKANNDFMAFFLITPSDLKRKTSIVEKEKREKDSSFTGFDTFSIDSVKDKGVSVNKRKIARVLNEYANANLEIVPKFLPSVVADVVYCSTSSNGERSYIKVPIRDISYAVSAAGGNADNLSFSIEMNALEEKKKNFKLMSAEAKYPKIKVFISSNDKLVSVINCDAILSKVEIKNPTVSLTSQDTIRDGNYKNPPYFRAEQLGLYTEVFNKFL